MNLAGASVWGRLLTWLEHEQQDEGYGRLSRTPVAVDETPRLDAFLSKGQIDPAKAEAAFERVAHRIRASHILFVPAVLSGIALKASRLRLIEYLTHQVRQLRDKGFEASIAEIDTGAPVACNGARLAEIITESHRPTWIVTHSKGGVDVLQALIAHPEARRFVDGWIAFQAPFQGSPIADIASGTRRARRLSGAALKLLSADLEAIGDLRTDRRARYMDQHASEIANVVQDVPVMCVGTVCGSSAAKGSLIPDWPTGRWMASQGLRNDGLVPVNSAILPGARYVELEGFGHGQVARNHIFSGRKLENVDLLKALFALMLEERDAPDAAAA
jgi:hypothetical protein